jgi:MoaA/NifB/PqqE/SkfB family radical SAM enzyme
MKLTHEMHKPFCIQVELTFGCQLRCPMCGINSLNIPRGKYSFMDVKTADIISKQISLFTPKIRIEFAMCGEPSMNPNVIEIVNIFRKNLPTAQLLFTTNGLNFIKDWKTWSSELVQCNIIAVDLYEPYGPELRDILTKNPGVWKVEDYYNSDFNQHHYNGSRGNHLVLIGDLLKNDRRKRQRIIFNHAGNSSILPKTPKPLRKTCTFPFREMVIRYEGTVNLCCLDFGSEYDVGNILNDDMKSIWINSYFTSARRFLRHKYRCFSPCIICDAPSGMRSGILPLFEEPTEKDLETVTECNEISRRLNHSSPKILKDWKEEHCYNEPGLFDKK